MRVLITGVCGFVGATLARGLRDVWPDLEIAGLDNFVRAGSELNRGPLRKLGVNLHHGDIRNASDLEDLPPCEWILDAAANPSVLAGVDGKTSSLQRQANGQALIWIVVNYEDLLLCHALFSFKV